GVGADVGLLFLAGRVDHHVVGAAVGSDEHPLVHLGSRTYEELAPALEVVQGVAGGDTGAVREHRTALTVREVTRPRHPTDVMGVQERSTPGGRDYEPPEAD